MKTRILPALVLLLAATAASASSEGKVDEATQAQIRTALTEQGYDVRSIQREDGMIEVYAMKDGHKLELYLDASLKIVREKQDD